MTKRTFVPFDSLWQMRIDVPYSLLVRDGDYAWSCGQLALDGDSNVLAAGNLAEQSSLVAGYIAQVLDRGGLGPEHLKRLLLYYVPDGPGNEQVEHMRSAFRSVLGHDVLLDPIPVPHFYYDGIVLEVDAFAGPTVDDRFGWVSVDAHTSDLDSSIEAIGTEGLLTGHWFAPAGQLADTAADLETRGLVHDAGAVVSAGPFADRARGSLVHIGGQCSEEHSSADGVRVTSRRADGVGWIAARSTDASKGLVQQTEQIMDAIAECLDDQGVGFDAVVKSTTLYVGGSSAEELHDNMSVRNQRYEKPGPASTGLPVFGFADPATLVTVDVLFLG